MGRYAQRIVTQLAGMRMVRGTRHTGEYASLISNKGT